MVIVQRLSPNSRKYFDLEDLHFQASTHRSYSATLNVFFQHLDSVIDSWCEREAIYYFNVEQD